MSGGDPTDSGSVAVNPNLTETGGVSGVGGNASADLPNGTVALPPCALGFVKDSSSLPCVYAYDGRCYDTKIHACACACPSRTGTTCISGFPELSGEVIVSCG